MALGRARAIHQTFEQGIARQAIGAVDTRAGRFAGRIKSGERSAAAQIRCERLPSRNAPRDESAPFRGAEVDVVLQAGAVNARKALLQAFAIQVRKVKIDDRLRAWEISSSWAMARATMSRGASSAISWYFGMKRLEIRIAQVSAFAAQRLRKQKARRALQIKSCRMELNELHVADLGAGPECHRDAIARSDAGVGGVGIDLAHAAGGQHDGCRRSVFGSPFSSQN